MMGIEIYLNGQSGNGMIYDVPCAPLGRDVFRICYQGEFSNEISPFAFSVGPVGTMICRQFVLRVYVTRTEMPLDLAVSC